MLKKRHFADSAQLLNMIPEGCRTLADLGSGAGFPGLVLAILRPDLEVHLVESDERKCEFLRTVSRETKAGAIIHPRRIEKICDEIHPDVVSARALASLEDLCGYCLSWAQENPALTMLFLKGEKAEEELEKARKIYVFEHVLAPSATTDNGFVMKLTHLSCV